MNSETNYINRIVDTTLFFFETMEEGDGGGSTQIIKLIKPSPHIRNVDLRNYVLGKLFRSCGLGLTGAAIELSRWLRAGQFSPFPIADEESKIGIACSPYERPAFDKQSVLIERPYRRLGRHIWRMQDTDVGRHSRVFDFYIPAQSIQRGRSVKAPAKGFHPEHVVPCAHILQICLDVLDKMKGGREIAPEEPSIARLVPLIKRLLWIVKLDDSERRALDEGDRALKDRMPLGWNVETGCIFQRLHEDPRIELELLPDGSKPCQCTPQV